MDTSARPRDNAVSFALIALACSLGTFGLLRLPWVEINYLLPLAGAQGGLAGWLFGAPLLPVQVTLACSGADVMALCLGATLSYPVAWRQRLMGAGAGVLLIAVLNTIRIGTLGRAVASPSWFHALHVYIWPALLIVLVAAYVFAWMSRANAGPRSHASRTTNTSMVALPRVLSVRFIVLALILLALFAAAANLLFESSAVLAFAGTAAGTAAALLRLMGSDATAAANMLSVPGAAFLVTQECVSSPVIPIYVAAVLCYARPWQKAGLGLLAAIPLIFAMAVARLLVVALPASATASAIMIHAFNQVLIGVVLIWAFAASTSGSLARSIRPALAGMAAGAVVAWVLAQLPPGVWLAGLEPVFADSQGALAMVPVFQLALLVALWVAAWRGAGWWRCVAGLALLALAYPAFVWAGNALALHAGITLHAIAIRGWAVGGPLLAIAVVTAPRMFGRQPATADESGGGSYRRFWDEVGETFPDLGGASSTRFYAADEQRLFNDYLAPLHGKRIFKTDLWDEAKNTRILAWASEQGALTYGADIAYPTVSDARRAFTAGALRGAAGDVRALPFADGVFDAIYSMGTIEHFDETERALAEIVRVLRPGGTAIIGVPNRHDPFLRPLLVVVLHAFGWYGYGHEKSYSRRALRDMVARAGLEVAAESAILFYPGALRMLDLACHAWCRPLTVVTTALGWPFVWLDRHVPAVRRHGYLLVAVARKPETERRP